MNLLTLFIHFFILACFSVGGFMASLPGIYDYLVTQAHLLTPEQFSSTVAFGQSMPGPNTLISPLLGWQVGGGLGALTTFLGTFLPALFFGLVVGRWVRKNAETLKVRAYKKGMAPITVGLMFASGYFLLQGTNGNLLALGWAFLVALLVWWKPLPPLLFILAGGIVGIFLFP